MNRILTRRRGALVLLLLGLCAVNLVSRGQNTASEPDTSLAALDAQVTRFLEGVSLGQSATAFDELLAKSPLLRRSDAVIDLKEKSGELEKRFGRFRAFERVGSRRVGQDVVILTYLYKCENFPVVWYFTFYRPTAAREALSSAPDWRVIALRFDTQIELVGQ